MAAIAKTNGINFLPYSPKRSLISKDAVVEFTDEEMKHFKRRFHEGYDVPGDTRYIQWLKIHHPECNTPHHVNPSSITATGCRDTNSISIDKNHPTNRFAWQITCICHCRFIRWLLLCCINRRCKHNDSV